MDYFCYISRTKIDQLHQNLTSQTIEDWSETQTTENGLSVEAHADWNLAKVISLFKGGITYGRKGVIQREQKLKTHYVEMLRQVLLKIARERPIPSLVQAMTQGEPDALYYHATGSFSIQAPLEHATPSDKVISLEAEIAGRKLVLDCSLRFFSDGNDASGTFGVNSANARFFSHRLALQMQTVFILLSCGPTQILGSPLYLKLSPSSVLPFAAL